MTHHGVHIVAQAISMKPHVILLDLELPGMDGQAVLIALKAEARTRAIPVVMCSGSTDARWQTLATKHGSTACVAKPASPELLVDVVYRALAAA